MKEKDIALIWDNLYFNKEKLKTLSGLPVEILSQGVYNHTMGVDFVDALVKIGNDYLQGGVEIHKKTSDWYNHKHYQKKSYNDTILHIVYEHDLKEKMSETVDSENANIIELKPLVSLTEDFDINDFNITLRPCFKKYRSMSFDDKVDSIYKAGKERLKGFISYLEALFEKEEPEKVLFTALAEAIGYGKNKKVMNKLSSLIPLSLVDEFIFGGNQYIINERIEAFLFWKSGLIKKLQSNKELYQNYKKHEKSFYMWNNLIAESVKYEEWTFGAVRPYNSPYRNIAALSSLYSKYLNKSLISDILTGYSENRDIIKTVTDILNSPVESIWHFYNTPLGKRSNLKKSFFTENRVNVIAANIIIPFVIIFCKREKNYELADEFINTYLELKGESFNRKTKFVFEQLSLEGSKVKKSICFMQGLLHLYKNFGEVYAD